jgi:uncharacterized OsmC-like protein
MYNASVANKGDKQYWATTKEYRFLMGEEGANAIDVLLASVCGCVGHHIRERLVERRIAFSKFTIEAEATRSDDKLFLTAISVVLKVEDCTLTPADKQDLQQQSGHCPLYNTLGKALAISFSVV